MFLLNPYPYCFLTVTNFTFTSHYVPIKSNLEKNLVNIFSPLHPIMFLLNQRLINSMMQEKFSLHPIMFLLNRYQRPFVHTRQLTFTSHYVPIKSEFKSLPKLSYCDFTSHYVPIKSNNSKLHRLLLYIFTSHYVPIKYQRDIQDIRVHTDLHPIMFLLNPGPGGESVVYK